MKKTSSPMEGNVLAKGNIRSHQANQSVLVSGDNNQIHFLINGDSNVDPAADTALQAYYRALDSRCNQLPLASIDTKLGDHQDHLTLEALYTDLHAVSTEPAPHESEHHFGLRLARGDGERQTLLGAVAAPSARFTILLGDPGSGKSTFVNYLSRRLIPANSPSAKDLPQSLRGHLPVLLVLRDLEPTGEGAGLLWDALHADIAVRIGKGQSDALFNRIQPALINQGLFLFDGLDEVAEQDGRRQRLLRAINELAASLGPEARILVTARPYAYTKEPGPLHKFVRQAIAPLDRQQMEAFVARWYSAMGPQMQWTQEQAGKRSADLTGALKQREYLADLGARPLLLTLIAALHSSRTRLPEDRADLYKASLELLLHSWQRRYDTKKSLDPDLVKALSLDEERLRVGLQKLAYDTHQRQGSDAKADGRGHSADIPASEIHGLFAPLLPRDFNSTVLLEYLDTRSGLLYGRGKGIYAFLHRSFQEYLAARDLCDSSDDLTESLVQHIEQDPEWWREVYLLAIGHFRESLTIALSLVETLLEEEGDTRLLLAAEACADLRLKGRPNKRASKLLQKVADGLVKLIHEKRMELAEIARAGDLLGRIGDPRPGVAVKDGLPDTDWVKIPPGNFKMGDDRSDYEIEKPAHGLILPGFFISRYPITNAQYALFIEANGYNEPRWWSEGGWAWRNGAEADLSPLDGYKDDQKRYADWLAERPQVRRDEPFWWHEPPLNLPNRPVVGINWYEAQAWCNWLTEQPAWKWGLVRLPSEAEWERAARGVDGRRWPWGDQWQEGRANTKECGLNSTCSVGLFPAAENPFELSDMIGNVWEWTSSRWGRRLMQADYGYPYDPADGRELQDGPDLRVIRGGSWYHEQSIARCSYRLWLIPGRYYDDLGFRVLCSPAPSNC